MANAIIHVTNLRLRTFIGFNPDEREKKQDVVINLEIHYPAEQACETSRFAFCRFSIANTRLE